MTSHVVDYEIFGDDMQIVEVELDPAETVIAEAGAMNYMDDGITYEARMGDGTEPSGGIMGKLIGAGNVFFHVGGTIIKKELRGETLRVDTGCLAAFTKAKATTFGGGHS